MQYMNMVSMVRNTDVDQKDANNAVVIAVTTHAVWSNRNIQSSSEPFGSGAAFPLIQAIQNVNKKLLDKNPQETQLFDVIMLSSDSEENQSRIIASTKHYGLEIGRFCFCSSREDTMDTLLSNRVDLFLSTDTADVSTALQRGMVSALVYQHTTDHSSDQLKVLLSGDAVGFSDEDSAPQQGFSEATLHDVKAARDSIMRFAALIGEMRKKFALQDSPISTTLLTQWGSKDVCARALRTLRAEGLMVEEAYCLAGAPTDPILSLLKPHIVFTDGL